MYIIYNKWRKICTWLSQKKKGGLAHAMRSNGSHPQVCTDVIFQLPSHIPSIQENHIDVDNVKGTHEGGGEFCGCLLHGDNHSCTFFERKGLQPAGIGRFPPLICWMHLAYKNWGMVGFHDAFPSSLSLLTCLTTTFAVLQVLQIRSLSKLWLFFFSLSHEESCTDTRTTFISPLNTLRLNMTKTQTNFIHFL